MLKLNIKYGVTFVFLLGLVLSACSVTPKKPIGFEADSRSLNPKLVESDILLPYARLVKKDSRYQLVHERTHSSHWLASNDRRYDIDKVGLVDLTTLKPLLNEKNLGGQLCGWGDEDCDRSPERKASSQLYQKAVSTGYYHRKINWPSTIMWQTLGQAAMLTPLILGTRGIQAEFSEKDFKAALDEALENVDVDAFYIAELEEIKMEPIRREQQREQERLRAEQLREQRRIQQEENRERERIRQENMRALWDAQRLSPKQVGDKICTFQGNVYGYVEQVAANGKIQVRQRGRALNKPSGLFFGLYDGRFNFTSTPVNTSIVWADSSEWGKCEFDN